MVMRGRGGSPHYFLCLWGSPPHPNGTIPLQQKLNKYLNMNTEDEKHLDEELKCKVLYDIFHLDNWMPVNGFTSEKVNGWQIPFISSEIVEMRKWLIIQKRKIVNSLSEIWFRLKIKQFNQLNPKRFGILADSVSSCGI